ncbi:hypothetical protein [Rubellicoccus peritrichatus]|uniref:Uncharacterized protein n=1 Tax=Rubellicoccus peritrichatus TaxID=3080537 RepID=A0AAQ3LFL4_9BACT|nr:hypothetical protein [Puniceicoccus sp. CR14]WOO42868.1 hypothetical protein RZN69_07170 [Puniceicoccus sp. CR14]
MIANRPLVLRSNRFLGAALTDAGLILNEDLEAANEKVLQAVQKEDPRGANLLNILLYDLQKLDEPALIDETLEQHDIGVIDLANYDLSFLTETEVSFSICWSTFTVPFDCVENFTMIATAYYLSKPTIDFWESQFDGPIIWYVSSVASIADALARAETEIEAKSNEKKGAT